MSTNVPLVVLLVTLTITLPSTQSFEDNHWYYMSLTMGQGFDLQFGEMFVTIETKSGDNLRLSIFEEEEPDDIEPGKFYYKTWLRSPLKGLDDIRRVSFSWTSMNDLNGPITIDKVAWRSYRYPFTSKLFCYQGNMIPELVYDLNEC